MKKCFFILSNLMLIFILTGCSKNETGLGFWEGFWIAPLSLLYAAAYFVCIAGFDDLSEGLMAVGYIMAAVACIIALVLYGIIFGYWWVIILTVALFIAYVVIVNIVGENWY